MSTDPEQRYSTNEVPITKDTPLPNLPIPECKIGSMLQDTLWQAQLRAYEDCTDPYQRSRAQLYMLRELALEHCEAADKEMVENLFERTISFTEEAWRAYHGMPREEERVCRHGFMVPTRQEPYPEEATEDPNELWYNLPALQMFPSPIRHAALMSLPPFKIDDYKPLGELDYRASSFFCPISPDMVKELQRLWNGNPFEKAQAYAMSRKLWQVMEDSVRLAQKYQYPGLEKDLIIGMGAFLAAISEFGKRLKIPEGVTTTTGHAGTVYLIGKTLERLGRHGEIDKPLEESSIGIIGAGSIGRASAAYLLKEHPGVTLYINDIDEGKLNYQVQRLKDQFPDQADKIIAVLGNGDGLDCIIENSDAIVSAVTTPVDISEEQINTIREKGIPIIDDSQPPAFPKDLVRIIWPIGVTNLLERLHFDYGGLGLVELNDLFGCEMEVFLIGLACQLLDDFDPKEFAISDSVKPSDITKLEQLIKEIEEALPENINLEVRAAEQQSYGRHV